MSIRNGKRLILFFILFLCLGLWRTDFTEAASQETSSLSAVKTGVKKEKQVKREEITSTEKLVKSFNHHLLNLDKKMSYTIHKKVAKNVERLEKILDKGIRRDILASYIYENAALDYTTTDFGGNSFQIVFDVNYRVKKSELSSLKKRFGLLKKSPIIKSRAEFEEWYLKLFYKSSKKIDLKVSNKFLNKYEIYDLLEQVSQEPLYRELYELASISYERVNNGKYSIIVIENSFKLSKEERNNIIKKHEMRKKLPTIGTIEKAREEFITGFYRLDKIFGIKVSKEVSKKFNRNAKKFLESLEDEPRFNDLKDYVYLEGNTLDYGDFDYFEFEAASGITKKEADAILAKVGPIHTTYEAFINEIVEKVENTEEKFTVNVSESVINLDDEKQRDVFWDSLYERPDFYDIASHTEESTYSWVKYKGYFKLQHVNKYLVSKYEIDHLKTFVKNWVATNIRATMTEEEKIRIINDFMVKEYRYSYGDLGLLSGSAKGTEKLGKYSVYTCFALIDGKGGVCNAKANMFYRLAKEAGIEVIYISGIGNGGDHAWNMVKVDGSWYHLDNTWNRGHYEGTSEYEYFNTRDYYLKGDETMKKDHSWDMNKYPVAPVDYQGYVPTAYDSNLTILKKVA